MPFRGPGVEDPVLRGDRLKVQVVVGVLEPFLQRVVIDVGDGLLSLHRGTPIASTAGYASSRSRLREGLVDTDGDSFPLSCLPTRNARR